MRTFVIGFIGAALVALLTPSATNQDWWFPLVAGLAIVGLVAGWVGRRYPGARWAYAGTVIGLGLTFVLDLQGVQETFWGTTEETAGWMAVVVPIVLVMSLGLGLVELAGYAVTAWLTPWAARRRTHLRARPPGASAAGTSGAVGPPRA